jgi:hypothetical protein
MYNAYPPLMYDGGTQKFLELLQKKRFKIFVQVLNFSVKLSVSFCDACYLFFRTVKIKL